MQNYMTDRKVINDNNQTYSTIDVFKFMFSICVVFMHTDLFESTPIGIYVTPLFKLAVPYFFVCSGFFLGKKIYQGKFDNRVLFTKNGYFYRLIQKLIVFEIIGVIIESIELILSGNSILHIILKIGRSVIFYPCGALWYIQATIVAVLLLIPIIRTGKEKVIIPLGVALFAIALLCNNYYFLIENTAIEPIIRAFLKVTICARNGVFFGFYFVGIGFIIAKGHNLLSRWKKRSLIITISMLVLYYVEVMMIQNQTRIDDEGLYIMQLFIVPLLFIATATNNIIIRNSKMLRNLSTSIYLIHSPLNEVIKLVLVVGCGFSYNSIVQTIILSFLVFIILHCIYNNTDSKVFKLLT